MFCKLRYILISLVACVSIHTVAQSQKYLSYIAQYKQLAIGQMRKHNIPASITMAQALLESAAGMSTLAQKGNNHFGIKCHNDWTGPYIIKTDDAPNERFRKYAFVEDSYEDHSVFLATRRRYESLFKLPITDYVAWARGLKAAGYATNPKYAEQLIRIIEDYKLTDLDQEALAKTHPSSKGKMVVAPTIPLPMSQGATIQRHVIGVNNHNYYIIAQAGDSYRAIAEEYETTERRLRRYNEVDKRYELKAGDIVYFKKKATKAHKKYKKKFHVVQSGESLYLISQKYGMRLKTLYKINKFTLDYTPKVGQKIKLR